jgi:hypothetical protein
MAAKEISVDHKPENPAEKARIVAKGGRVFAVEYDDGIDGPHRVWLGHMDVPGLAMSRWVPVFLFRVCFRGTWCSNVLFAITGLFYCLVLW